MAQSLKQKLITKGIDSSDLDLLVDDAASRLASAANNDGISAQLELLERAGLSEAEILAELG